MAAPAKLSAFVLMPFDASFEDVYRFGIKATVEEHGMNAARVDEQVFHHEGILERIRNQIDAADFIIADVSSKNPNVFYEIGYAHAKQKTTILLTTDAANLKAEFEARGDDQIRITSPLEDQLLEGRESRHKGATYVVRGTLKHLPTNHTIWLLNVNESADEVWPQIIKVKYDFPQPGEWEGRTYLSSNQKSVIIYAVVAPPTSNDLFRFYEHSLQYQMQPLSRIPGEINFARVRARAPQVGPSNGADQR
jgi:nucleoside 2-deoxyribosyltransferase